MYMAGLREATFNQSGEGYFYCNNKNTKLVSLAKSVSKVKILIRSWPDLPRWFKAAIYIATYINT